MSGKKNLKVVAALIKKEDKLLLCQRKETDAFGLLWEFPGGKIEEAESHQEALKREIKEELNLSIEPGPLEEVFEDQTQELSIEVFLYQTHEAGGRISCLECEDYGFFDLSQIAGLKLAPVDKKIFDYLKGKQSDD